MNFGSLEFVIKSVLLTRICNKQKERKEKEKEKIPFYICIIFTEAGISDFKPSFVLLTAISMIETKKEHCVVSHA